MKISDNWNQHFSIWKFLTLFNNKNDERFLWVFINLHLITKSVFMTNVLPLIVGGIAGTLLRHGISGWVYNLSGGLFPWGTITVNMIGSLTIGFLWGFLDVDHLSSQLKNLLFIGFLGSFTTFSAFSIETLNLARSGEMKLAVLNLLVSNIGGLVFVFAGFIIGRQLHLFVK